MFLFEHILVIASRSSREKKLKKKLQQKKLGWWRNNYNFKSCLINIIRLRFREQPVQGASNWKCNKYLQDLGVGCYRFYDNIDNELWSNLETLYNFPIFRFDFRVVTWYMGSGLKAQNMTGIRAQRKGLRAQKNGIRDHKAFEPKSGIRFITRSKNFLAQYFSP